MKRALAIFICTMFLFGTFAVLSVKAEENFTELEISAPSVILMEASTGTVLYEKDADTKRAPASVTKIMTMLLIFDALAEGKIKLTDEVTVSEHAASMGALKSI